jgi:hypothetical protein
VFIYADESGNTGRNLFDLQSIYWQGAIISVEDLGTVLEPVIDALRRRLSVDRLHAAEMRSVDSVRAITALMDALDASSTWAFHVTEIEKSWVATTKFVDTVFDSGLNKGARWHWYNVEAFRHLLCLILDSLFTDALLQDFWRAFLADDADAVGRVIRQLWDELKSRSPDPRLSEVIGDAFRFALDNPDEITLAGSGRKTAYKPHTPNMIAFTSLIAAVHEFATEHRCEPQAFIHDTQSEFNSVMREYHKMLNKFLLARDPQSDLPTVVDMKTGLGEFRAMNSAAVPGLQAVDMLLYGYSKLHEPKYQSIRERIEEKVDAYYISRSTSVMLASIPLMNDSPSEDLARARELLDEGERRHHERLARWGQSTNPP